MHIAHCSQYSFMTLLGTGDFRLHVETPTTLFHPDFHVVVVEEGGKVMRKTIDTRAIVAGHVEGQC